MKRATTARRLGGAPREAPFVVFVFSFLRGGGTGERVRQYREI
ncbi:conserved hypothetical protein [Burkholderia pseudomallei 1106b]|uniref:Uncharacterized protein n=1 Tax=Burkholderia pseudomallei (strain 1106a) TaxID=357348 RepID=A3P8A1_BURP0|nr:conserved hypothetical protein [Burkholderia pseudomallei 1106a]EEC34596.1 conserved hypothetical protein [Burkholderia pseudomallei 576]EES22785.1 conserved hypothetical protein [Burkholderia pseudomallei 1106b]